MSTTWDHANVRRATPPKRPRVDPVRAATAWGVLLICSTFWGGIIWALV